jgi:light-regulated signal transduction histidine kinase (bacteriophytochrome)
LENTNRQLAQINQALEASNNDLQQFASVASHDLQEPLRKIQIFSNLLLNQTGNSLTPDSQKYVGKIVDAASRMKTLIVYVLNYSKLSAHDPALGCVNLNEVVQELLDDFKIPI